MDDRTSHRILAAGWLLAGLLLSATPARSADAPPFAARTGLTLATAAPAATMLLMRGAFSEGDPDTTSWTLVYSAPGAPSLFVVVDAAAGKVQRTWRG